jgi:hypothetical protein
MNYLFILKSYLEFCSLSETLELYSGTNQLKRVLLRYIGLLASKLFQQAIRFHVEHKIPTFSK